VLSYQSEGLPSREELLRIFRENGKKVKVFEKEHRYALSAKKTTELLFVATD
jgi:adenine-specific DNA methylase